MEDGQGLNHIDELAKEEYPLYSKERLNGEERQRLHKLTIESDQCRDPLRQRRGLCDVHANPDMAKVRSAKVVENYEQ
jgi:hypothetical protein